MPGGDLFQGLTGVFQPGQDQLIYLTLVGGAEVFVTISAGAKTLTAGDLEEWMSAGKVQAFGQVSAPDLGQGHLKGGGHASGVINFAHVAAARIVYVLANPHAQFR